MEYVCQRVMHSWVAMFQHIEAPRDCIDVDELSLPEKKTTAHLYFNEL